MQRLEPPPPAVLRSARTMARARSLIGRDRTHAMHPCPGKVRRQGVNGRVHGHCHCDSLVGSNMQAYFFSYNHACVCVTVVTEWGVTRAVIPLGCCVVGVVASRRFLLVFSFDFHFY